MNLTDNEVNAINQLLSGHSQDTWSQLTFDELVEWGQGYNVDFSREFARKCLRLGIGEKPK